MNRVIKIEIKDGVGICAEYAINEVAGFINSDFMLKKPVGIGHSSSWGCVARNYRVIAYKTKTMDVFKFFKMRD